MNYFARADIVVLAEAGHGKFDELIIEIIKAHVDALSGLMWEIPVDYQNDIDTFVCVDVITDHLRRYIEGALLEGHDLFGMFDIIRMARSSGISVTCIDSSKSSAGEYRNRSSHGCYFLKGKSRDEDMMTNIVGQYQKSPGKYLVIVGAAHAVSGNHFKTGLPALGWFLDRQFTNNHSKLLLKRGRVSTFRNETLDQLLAD